MIIADIELDKRLIKINGREVKISLTAELDQDTDLEQLRGSTDFGDPQENAAYLARFESGELINVQVRVRARWDAASGFISGEDILPGLHLQPFDYEDPEAHELKGRLLERLENIGIINTVIEELSDNIRKTLSELGLDGDRVSIDV